MISAVRDTLYQLTSTGIQCPWCAIESGISGAYIKFCFLVSDILPPTFVK